MGGTRIAHDTKLAPVCGLYCGSCELLGRLCPDFPCPVFLEMRDPALSNEEARKALEVRQADLRRRKEMGTEAWLEEKARG